MPFIGPEADATGVYVFSDHSVAVPSGAMWASPPYGEETDRFSVGADAHIGPDAGGTGVYVFSDHSVAVPSGAMWASPPYGEETDRFFVGADALHRPGSRRYGHVRLFRPLWYRTQRGDVGIAPYGEETDRFS